LYGEAVGEWPGGLVVELIGAQVDGERVGEWQSGLVVELMSA